MEHSKWLMSVIYTASRIDALGLQISRSGGDATVARRRGYTGASFVCITIRQSVPHILPTCLGLGARRVAHSRRSAAGDALAESRRVGALGGQIGRGWGDETCAPVVALMIL